MPNEHGPRSTETAIPSGPLKGLRVLEFASIGPGPHCGMLLSDLGAEVLRIDRPGENSWANPIMDRGRHRIVVDIRTPGGLEFSKMAAVRADVLLEGMRPGVMERLGLGPERLCAGNPKLIYTRLTGWGQTGPRAQTAGHDINYIALTGALAEIGVAGMAALPPLNLIGDLAGGSLFAAMGILAALHERDRSGCGQVIDVAMVDGVVSLMSMFTGLMSQGVFKMGRGVNLLAGAAPFYRCYTCADGHDIAVGALEPQFYRILVQRAGAPAEYLQGQYERENWPARSTAFAQLFASRPRADWVALFDGLDACVAPVWTLGESTQDDHLRGRDTYLDVQGVRQPAPAPRFSRTPGSIQAPGEVQHLLKRWGL
jgi:alpha-methylacyl-CoA racemase